MKKTWPLSKHTVSPNRGDAFTDGVLGAAFGRVCSVLPSSNPFTMTLPPREISSLEDEEIEKFVWLSWRAGLQFSAHAVGDRAFAQLMTAYEKAYKKRPGNGRFRIEHAPS